MKSRRILVLSTVIIGILILVTYFVNESNYDSGTSQNDENNELIEWKSGKLFNILVDPNDLVLINGKTVPLKATFGLKEGLEEIYNEIGLLDSGKKSIFVIPTFTASAYSKNGFYDFYNGYCDEKCLTTEIVSIDKLDYSSSANAVKVLQLLGYHSITDLELHKEPDILKNYEKVIILHNEYVSKVMFDSITSHDNVIFLYPNSLYGKIKVNSDNSITLIRGHGYPESDIENGFNWENENTHPYEFDNKCEDWEFYQIQNGYMLNCYPEQIIWKNELLLKTIKEL